MATVALNKAIAAKTISGNAPTVLFFPEASGQSFKIGEFVYLANGKVTEVGNNPTLILGMAAADASGTVDTPIPVIIACDDVVFEFNKVTAAGAASATAITDVGRPFGIYRDTTKDITHAKVDDGNGRLLCIGLSGKDAVGDTGGRILCIVMGRHRQFFSTS